MTEAAGLSSPGQSTSSGSINTPQRQSISPFTEIHPLVHSLSPIKSVIICHPILAYQARTLHLYVFIILFPRLLSPLLITVTFTCKGAIVVS